MPLDPPIVAHLIGYSVAMLVPVPALMGISRLLWIHLVLDARERADDPAAGHQAYLPALLGVLERFLYVAALLQGYAEFVGVWLALKVAGGWKGWTEGEEGIHGRHLFNSTLIGSGLSLVWAVVGAAIVAWLVGGRPELAVSAGVASFLVTYLLWLGLHLAKRKRAAPKE